MKDLGLAPNTVRTNAVDLIRIVREGPDAEISKWWDGSRAC